MVGWLDPETQERVARRPIASLAMVTASMSPAAAASAIAALSTATIRARGVAPNWSQAALKWSQASRSVPIGSEFSL